MSTNPLKIAIVGAGMCGLSTFLFLEKELPTAIPHEILIFESHDSPTRRERENKNEVANSREAASFIRGGLGVAPNGMRVLRELSPEIHDAVVAQGYPTLRFQIKNSRNWTLGSMPTADLSGKTPEMMIMSRRQGVWDCLRDRVPDEILHTGKAVAKVGRGLNLKPVLEFEDGTATDEFDLVIGADGIKSVVKEVIPQSDQARPIYEGVCGIGGFVPSSYLPPIPSDRKMAAPHSPVVMTFGADGFFGYGPCEVDGISSSPHLTVAEIKENKAPSYGPLMMWWSTFSAEKPNPTTQDADKEAVHNQLLERHSKWQDPVIQKVLHEPAIGVMTATYITPKMVTWTADRVILIGDAAHTLPSTSGQGVSQALEDAQALALLLAHYLQEESSSTAQSNSSSSSYARQVQAATTAFQVIRKPRVERILDVSRRMGNRKKKMGPVGEWTTYALMWVMCTLFSGMMQRLVGDWDIQVEMKKAIEIQKRTKPQTGGTSGKDVK